MTVEVRTIGAARVLSFKGKITRGAGDVEMREHFRQQLDDGGKDFVFDLSEVAFVDSAAVGEMVACLKRARQRDGELKLVLIRGGRPEQLLKLAALDRVFESFDDEQRAVASFSD